MFNGQIKCIKAVSDNFVEGKIYIIINGRIQANIMQHGTFESFRDLQQNSIDEWEQVN